MGSEKELSRNLGQKGQCWCSRLGLKVPKPACGGVKMLHLKESLQVISSAAGWHKLIVPWRALKSLLPLSLPVTYRLSLKLSSVFERWLNTHYEVCQREVVTVRTKLRWLDSSGYFWLKFSQAGESWADVPFP